MTSMVQRKLEEETIKLNRALRKYGTIDGRSENNVTAIVWATWDECSKKQQTGVIMVNGVLTGNYPIRKGDHLAGLVLELSFLNSEPIGEMTRKNRETKCISINPVELLRGDLSFTGSVGPPSLVQFDKVNDWTYRIGFRKCLEKFQEFQVVPRVCFKLLQILWAIAEDVILSDPFLCGLIWPEDLI